MVPWCRDFLPGSLCSIQSEAARGRAPRPEATRGTLLGAIRTFPRSLPGSEAEKPSVLAHEALSELMRARPPKALGKERCSRRSCPHPAATAAVSTRQLAARGGERWHFVAGGPEATDRIPREDSEGGGSEGLRVFGYDAGAQQAECLLILIGASVGLVTPGVLPWRGPKKARGMTPAEPNAHTPWEAVKV